MYYFYENYHDKPLSEYFSPEKMRLLKQNDPSSYSVMLGMKNEEFQMNYLRDVFNMRAYKEENRVAPWDLFCIFGRQSVRLRIQSKLKLSRKMILTRRAVENGHAPYNSDSFEYLMITRSIENLEAGILSNKGMIFLPIYELKDEKNPQNLIKHVPNYIADSYTNVDIRKVVEKTYRNFI